MAMMQLTGGPIACPEGALELRLTHQQGVELELVGAEGFPIEPTFRATPTQVVIVPEHPVSVVARAADGRPFAEGTRIGITVKAASGSGNEVVRPPVEAGGRLTLPLVEIADGQISDLVGQSASVELAWMQRGNQAFHTNHSQRAIRSTKWACVVDGSAIPQQAADPVAYRSFLELVLGIASTAHGGAPESWMVATRPPREIAPTLTGDAIAWEQALGHDPAPWPSFGDAVDAACAKIPDDAPLLLISDGVFVDYREVRAALPGRQCTVVALGTSKYGVRPQDKPSQFWEEELAAFEGFDRVASLASLEGLADVGPALADAMFPKGDA